MILSLLAVLCGILLFSASGFNLLSASNDFATNKYHFVSTASNSSGEKNRLQICCSWSERLSDGILKYSIEADEKEEKQIRGSIISSIKEWDSKLEELQLIEEKRNPLASDIRIVFSKLDEAETGNQYYDFKNKVDKDLTLIPSAGWTKYKINKQGFIDGTKIIISKDVFKQNFGKDIIKQIVKHELGHALGLGHSNYKRSLMANLVIEDKTTSISGCEIDGVYTANSWKFSDSKMNPEHPQRMFVSC